MGSDEVTRVLVTGSQGYIGSVLSDALASQGYQVKQADLGLYNQCRYPGGVLPVVPWDARRAELADFEGIDAVVHLAALSNDPLGDLDPALTYAINHDGTVHTAEVARAAGVTRFIFASSCSLYGASGGSLADESAELDPQTPYAETKVSAEIALAALAGDDFSPVFLRNATVYGPSPGLRLDLVVNDLCATAVATGEVLLKSDGSAWRPQVHVDDAAGAVLAALKAPREAIHSEAINIGRTEDNLKVLDIASVVAEAANAEIVFADGGTADTRSYRVDFSKVERLLPDFKPRWTVEKGIAQLLRTFSQDHIDAATFGRYRRLTEIQRLKGLGQLSSSLEWSGAP